MYENLHQCMHHVQNKLLPPMGTFRVETKPTSPVILKKLKACEFAGSVGKGGQAGGAGLWAHQ